MVTRKERMRLERLEAWARFQTMTVPALLNELATTRYPALVRDTLNVRRGREPMDAYVLNNIVAVDKPRVVKKPPFELYIKFEWSNRSDYRFGKEAAFYLERGTWLQLSPTEKERLQRIQQENPLRDDLSNADFHMIQALRTSWRGVYDSYHKKRRA